MCVSKCISLAWYSFEPVAIVIIFILLHISEIFQLINTLTHKVQIQHNNLPTNTTNISLSVCIWNAYLLSGSFNQLHTGMCIVNRLRRYSAEFGAN